MHPFEVMAEPVRRRVIDILASGEHTATELASILGSEFRISRSAVSKHLRLLREEGFVAVRTEERWRWYRLVPNAIDVLQAVVRDLRAKQKRAVGWDAVRKVDYDPLAGFPRRGGAAQRRDAARPVGEGRVGEGRVGGGRVGEGSVGEGSVGERRAAQGSVGQTPRAQRGRRGRQTTIPPIVDPARGLFPTYGMPPVEGAGAGSFEEYLAQLEREGAAFDEREGAAFEEWDGELGDV